MNTLARSYKFTLQNLKNRYMSNVTKEQIRIKRVCKDDFDHVMAVRSPHDIACGTDYLADFFHVLLKMPSVEMYAALIHGKFVGFQFISIVDDGKTLVFRGGRISKQYEGVGITGAMLRWFDEGQPLHKPDILYYAIGSVSPGTLDSEIEKGKFNEVLRQEVRFYKASVPKLRLQQKKERDNEITTRVLNNKALSQCFMSEALNTLLFKQGRVIVDGVPYRIVPSNASLMLHEKTRCLGSELDSPEIALLSFGSYFRTPIALLCNLDFYGNFSRLDHHVHHYVNNFDIHHVHKTDYDNCIIRCSCPPTTDWNYVSTVMNKFDFSSVDVEGPGYICAERKVKVY